MQISVRKEETDPIILSGSKAVLVHQIQRLTCSKVAEKVAAMTAVTIPLTSGGGRK